MQTLGDARQSFLSSEYSLLSTEIYTTPYTIKRLESNNSADGSGLLLKQKARRRYVNRSWLSSFECVTHAMTGAAA
eukprot:scaffold529299_cov18-Prasinocladus_malaysianus.AAC.1